MARFIRSKMAWNFRKKLNFFDKISERSAAEGKEMEGEAIRVKNMGDLLKGEVQQGTAVDQEAMKTLRTVIRLFSLACTE